MRFASENNKDFHPVWMAPEEINDPAEFIKEYCRSNSIVYCRFILWQILSNSVSTENQHIDASPGEQLYFFENLMPLIEAIYLLQQKAPNKVSNSIVIPDCIENEIIQDVHTENPVEAKIIINQASKHKFETRKFKKRERRLRKHSIWYLEQINDPFKVISEFFDSYSIISFKTDFFNVLQASSANHFYKKGSPSDLLYIFGKLESIVNAAYLVGKFTIEDQLANRRTVFDELLRDSCGSLTKTLQILPSSLSEAEINEPEKVLNDFFQYKSVMNWKKEFNEIFFFALSKESIFEASIWIDFLAIYNNCVKLTEAIFIISLHKEQVQN